MDTKNRKDIFDENFEVTYEEEFPEIPVDDQNDYPTYKTSIDSNFSEDIYSQPYRAPSDRSPNPDRIIRRLLRPGTNVKRKLAGFLILPHP